MHVPRLTRTKKPLRSGVVEGRGSQASFVIEVSVDTAYIGRFPGILRGVNEAYLIGA